MLLITIAIGVAIYVQRIPSTQDPETVCYYYKISVNYFWYELYLTCYKSVIRKSQFCVWKSLGIPIYLLLYFTCILPGSPRSANSVFHDYLNPFITEQWFFSCVKRMSVDNILVRNCYFGGQYTSGLLSSSKQLTHN